MGFLDSLTHTLKSLGGAVSAPVGLAFDLASMPFDNKDDDFGSVLSAAAHRTSNVFDPLTDSSTWTGYGLSKVMHGLNWAYKEGVDRPVGTAETVWGHALYDPSQIGDLFDKQSWAQAYAESRTRSAGQSAVLDTGALIHGAAGLIGLHPGWTKTQKEFSDPLDPKAWADTAKNAPGTLGATAFVGDIGLSWVADPGVLAGKAVSAMRMSNLGKLTAFDRSDFEAKLAGTSKATGIRARDWSGRFDSYFKYISGDNHLGRQLNAAEIHAASPELQRSAQGKAIAGLMEDALKLPRADEQQNTLRRVIAVAAGDSTQIDRITAESDSAHAIADALRNLENGTTAHLHLQALKDEVRMDPEFNAEFERQLDNLNSEGEIDAFVKEWGDRVRSRLDANTRLLGVKGDLNFVPGKHGVIGDHALRVQHGESIGAKVAQKHDDTIKWAQDLANRESYTGVFQKSLYHMPLVVAHPAGLLASPYTKWLHGGVRALRTTHFNGLADLHDWNSATTQLDSMMKLAGVDDAARIAHLGDAYKASSEAEKRTAIHAVERTATQSLADQMSQKLGYTVSPDFIDQLVFEGQLKRKGWAARTDGGRIYAATPAPESMASGLRDRAMAKAEASGAPTNDPELDAGFQSLAPGANQPWRIDQIPDENGLPMALPLTTAQLGNRVPLFDVHLAKQLTGDAIWRERFGKIARAWEAESLDLNHLQAQLARTGAKGADRLAKLVDAKRASVDALVHAGGVMTRWWKYSVLFRLGYPMRVLMDDHMRIAAQMHYGAFAAENMREGVGNLIYNNAPALIYSGGRKAAARQAFTRARADRKALTLHFGRDAHTDEEWSALRQAINSGDMETVRKLDPKGKVAEHYDSVREAQSLQRAIQGHSSAISRWKAKIAEAETKHSLGIDHGEDIPALWRKIHEAEAEITDKSAGRTHILDQLGEDPEVLRKRLLQLNESIKKGMLAFADPKRHLGEQGVKLDENLLASGVYGPRGGMYKLEAGSQEHYTTLLTDGEESTLGLLSSGAYRSVQPSEPGHTHLWANVLNHQFQNSPELMAFVRGKVSTPEEFAKWVAEPEQAYIRDRMRHFAADPVDWGSRLQELYHDYIPTVALRDAVKDGRVSARKLKRMFPDASLRPVVHGQLADINSGRHTATLMFSDAANRMFRLLSEVPTDNLSRHPFMNAVYKQELRDLYAARKMDYAKLGKEFTQEDLYDLERAARIKALGHLKRTLWDVSAHSNAAHTMRFLSPFFAAHQEALTRWWRIATDDPSVVRKFQLAFDIPRKAGLTYDPATGEVNPGDSISQKHQILLRVPFAKDSSAVNTWLRKMGGGKYWHVNENGFNLILQNGIANPGVGPVVTVPMESLVNKYASKPEIEKVARVLNPYPPDSPWQAVEPAWAKRLHAYIQGPGNKEWGRQYNSNLSDAVIQWRTDHGERIPTEAQFNALAKKAADDTNRDLMIMLLSNMTSPLPAKPESKYAVVQHGVSRILSQMRAGGHDYHWAQKQVRQKYGDVYTALLYSQTNNKSHLKQTYAEVDAMKLYRGLLDKTDPTLARMIVGPKAAMDAKQDPGLGKYSAAARRFLMNQKVSPYSTDTYLSQKDPTEAGVASMIDAGWTQYEELTNWLTVQAKSQGLNSYEDSETLVAAKRAGIQYLLKSNYAFAHEWNSYDHGTAYEEKLADMRLIANDKALRNDPTRQDVHWLDQYLQLRDAITQAMAARKAAGGAGTITAKANVDLAKAFYAGVQYIRDQNTYFDTYSYHGIIERDPYLLAVPGGN